MITTDHAVITTDHPVITTDHPVITTDHAVITTDHAVIATDHAVITLQCADSGAASPPAPRPGTAHAAGFAPSGYKVLYKLEQLKLCIHTVKLGAYITSALHTERMVVSQTRDSSAYDRQYGFT